MIQHIRLGCLAILSQTRNQEFGFFVRSWPCSCGTAIYCLLFVFGDLQVGHNFKSRRAVQNQTKFLVARFRLILMHVLRITNIATFLVNMKNMKSKSTQIGERVEFSVSDWVCHCVTLDWRSGFGPRLILILGVVTPCDAILLLLPNADRQSEYEYISQYTHGDIFRTEKLYMEKMYQREHMMLASCFMMSTCTRFFRTFSSASQLFTNGGKML